jgi:hypothetical protein
MLALLLDQPRAAQLSEVEGERTIGDAERPGDRARRHPVPAGLHEQPEQREPILLRKSAQSVDDRPRIHGHFFISIFAEMKRNACPVKINSIFLEMKLVRPSLAISEGGRRWMLTIVNVSDNPDG